MRKFLTFLLLALSLIIFDQLGVIRPLRGGIEKILVPIEERLYDLKRREDERARGRGELERKIAVLESEISTLKKENADMRRLLGAPLPQTWKFQPARVIGTEDGTLLIDKGRADNVFLGQVAVFENIFVGKITSLGEYISRLETPKSQNLKIPVVVRTKTAEGITARGLLTFAGGKLLIDRVLPEEQILEGDLVLTAGKDGYPSDLLIGKLVKIERGKSEGFQKGEVEPLISPFSLENVFLVILK
ncbi:MAG: rod shape-determining protein MreC [Patescibacteria group bacterium]